MSDSPFRLQVGYDQAELLGARWWQQSLPQPAADLASIRRSNDRQRDERQSEEALSRRRALQVMAGLGGVLLVGGIAVSAALDRSGTGTEIVGHDSLELQRQRGLAALAKPTEFLWLDSVDKDHAGAPLDRARLPQLAIDLRPSDPAWMPLYVPTLFQAFGAPDAAEFTRQFQMVNSAAMQRAFAQGAAVRELIEMVEEPLAWALLIDLRGPESTAFAAGLTPTMMPVFLFGNWPHPRGVVPSHQTLGAAVFYRSRFLAKPDGGRRPVALVLDRDRLHPYQNDANRFDNRYTAKLPTAAQLKQNGVRHLMYVVPPGTAEEELDDLNQRFVEYGAAGIEVKMLGLQDLVPAPIGSPNQVAGRPDNRDAHYGGSRFWWHGSPNYHGWFWNQYGAASRPYGIPVERPPSSSFGSTFGVRRREAAVPRLSGLGRTNETRPRSTGSGGSWGRSSGGSGG